MVVVEGVMDVGPICLLVRIALSLKEHNNLPSQVSPFCSIFSFFAEYRHFQTSLSVLLFFLSKIKDYNICL